MNKFKVGDFVRPILICKYYSSRLVSKELDGNSSYEVVKISEDGNSIGILVECVDGMQIKSWGDNRFELATHKDVTIEELKAMIC
jgi:hypothetical protein